MRMSVRLLLSIAIAVSLLAGCSSYTVPGGPAELAVLGVTKLDQANYTDPDLRKHFDAKPLAQFPAMVAVARVQGANYQSRTANVYGHGRYSVVTTRDVEAEETVAKLGKLPQVRGIAAVSRMLLPARLESEQDLRSAAARVKADMLLLYTFDTQFYVRDYAKPVTVVTLGLSPNRKAFVTTTASAVLLDTRSGFVYGGAEATAKSAQLASGWTDEDAVDDTRQRTERESFEKLVASLEKEWPAIVAEHTGRLGK
jgi:hypothetical protein